MSNERNAGGTSEYEAVIGLEVHAQLLTESKAFSPDSAAFGAGPNLNVDPISLGHPGTLPVLNERLVTYTIRMGLATNCRIAPRSVMARKHYFYPDLPKGYQISQYETPICEHGYIDVEDEGASRRIGIKRIHMEEDAGKLMHDQDPYNSLADYNRCGVPLMEIVSDPDLRTPHEAYLYMQKMRQIVRYLGICDGNMEEGSLRCDANISVRKKGEDRLGTKAEIKNMNSFRNVERAIQYEIDRQIAILEKGGEVVQETRLWDANKQETRSMRSKEEAHDYRYFPDPDLVEVLVDEQMLADLQASLPEMPEARRTRFVKDLELPAYDAEILTEDRGVADYFEASLRELSTAKPGEAMPGLAKAVSNWVMTDVLRVLKEQDLSIESFPIGPMRLAGLIVLRLEDQISSSAATEIFNIMLGEDLAPEVIARNRNLLQVSDDGALLPVIRQVISENEKQVQQYLGGKESVAGFFIGQVMRAFPGAPDPKVVRSLVVRELDALKS